MISQYCEIAMSAIFIGCWWNAWVTPLYITKVHLAHSASEMLIQSEMSHRDFAILRNRNVSDFHWLLMIRMSYPLYVTKVLSDSKMVIQGEMSHRDFAILWNRYVSDFDWLQMKCMSYSSICYQLKFIRCIRSPLCDTR